jgi:predicted membrane protein
METEFKPKQSPKAQGIIFGILLILAGLLFLSFNFGWIDSALKSVIFSWPMLFIVFSIMSFSKKDYAFGSVWLIAGLFFLLPRLSAAYPGYFTGIDSDFTRVYWPLLLIIVGIVIVFSVLSGKNRKGGFCGHHPMQTQSTESSDGVINKSVTFGGSESIFLDPVFNGGNISAVFGGVVLDLRKTSLPEGETYLDIYAVFGGVELYIPDNWLVETKIQTVLGGVEDKRFISQTDHSRKLILLGNLTFGGCSIH